MTEVRVLVVIWVLGVVWALSLALAVWFLGAVERDLDVCQRTLDSSFRALDVSSRATDLCLDVCWDLAAACDEKNPDL